MVNQSFDSNAPDRQESLKEGLFVTIYLYIIIKKLSLGAIGENFVCFRYV